MSDNSDDDSNTIHDDQLTKQELESRKVEKREYRERERIINIVVNTVDIMMTRQRKCEDLVVRYALLANTLMTIFDTLSATVDVFSSDFDQKSKTKIHSSLSNMQNDLDNMMKWICTRSVVPATQYDMLI